MGCRKFISTGIDARKSATFRQASRSASVNIDLHRTGALAEEIGMVRPDIKPKEPALIWGTDVDFG